MSKYQVEFSDKQLSVMAEALDFYSRFCAGQLTRIPKSLELWLWNKGASIRAYDKHMTTLKKEVFDMSANSSLGIHSDDLIEEAKIANDICRPIYELRAKDSDSSVYAYTAEPASAEGRIIIKEL